MGSKLRQFVLPLLLILGTTVNGFLPAVKSSKIVARKNGAPSFPSFVPIQQSTTLFQSSNDENNNDGGILSKIPRPTLSQIVCVWLVAVSGNRLFQMLPSLFVGHEDGAKFFANIAFNGIFFAGSVYTLAKSFLGIDYSKLEGLDSKSWGQQAGRLASEGTIPTQFVDPRDPSKVYQVATFAGGCFWGTELRYQRQVGVIATTVGYTQGNIDKPNYEQVCSGSTGHTEGIQLIYDPTVCSYERLVTLLLDSLDPTLRNQVGNDRGTQYRHGIYPHTEEQMEIAKNLCQRRQSQYSQPIVTEVKPAAVFWPAENYHQRYLEKRGQSAEKNCEDTVRCYG